MARQDPTTKSEQRTPVPLQQEKAKPTVRRNAAVQKLPPYHVVLLDDQDHTYQYVMEMLSTIFGCGTERTYAFAREVDRSGRVIVFTTHRELAELKREQIRGFGCDPRLARSRGSMGAVIEPASN